VRIISVKALREFAAKHSDAAAALAVWRTIVRQADWKSSADVKATFSNSDLVGEETVFNIARNRYRMIAYVSFRGGKVFVKAILTHKEYDQGAWKK
jgi:mRNA interferase HigB